MRTKDLNLGNLLSMIDTLTPTAKISKTVTYDS